MLWIWQEIWIWVWTRKINLYLNEEIDISCKFNLIGNGELSNKYLYYSKKNSKYTDNKLYPVLIKIKPSIH